MPTSITSFIGFMPIVMESSLQAKLLILCAISMAFGCLSNLGNTLVLVSWCMPSWRISKPSASRPKNAPTGRPRKSKKPMSTGWKEWNRWATPR